MSDTSEDYGDVSVMINFVPISNIYASRLRQICVKAESIRTSKDYIWRMAMGKKTKEHDHWYFVMAQSMLRMLRCLPDKRQNSNLSVLTKELFGIDQVIDLAFLKEIEFDDLITYTQMWFGINTAITLILTFVRDDYEGSMKGSSEATREARKSMARTAFFFISLHYDISFLRLVLDQATGVDFFDKRNILGYIRTGLYGAVMYYINGGITDTPLFVTECISSYVQVTNIDPFASLPLSIKPPEDPTVVHPRYIKKHSESKAGRKENGGFIIGFDPRGDDGNMKRKR